VWAREGLAYIASHDSSAVAEGDRLTFLNRRKPIASGEVVRVVDGELLVAKLTSGSLMRIKKLDRLRILTERPRLGALSVLRVGYPEWPRTDLLFGCVQTKVDPPRSAYKLETLSADSYRLVRASEASIQAPWPDTILVRFFDEAADQEIALERGELDVAVFWPGELSAHARSDRRWQGHLFGTRRRGILAAFWDGPISPDDSSTAFLGRLDLTPLNQQMFRGDLAPWVDVASSSVHPDSLAGSPRPRDPVRYSVDASLPGRRVIAQFLDRGGRSRRNDLPTVRLFTIDAPIDTVDSLLLELAAYVRTHASSPDLRARADRLAVESWLPGAAHGSITPGALRRHLRDLQVASLFAVRCPVVCGPELKPYVEALGADVFANMLICVPMEHRP
jgi:hypothetical protein